MNSNQLTSRVLFITFLVISHSSETSSLRLGLFTQFKSTGRIFTSMRSITAKTIQACCFHCISEELCTGFNLVSNGSSSYECTLGFTQTNITCTSLLKKQHYDYYDRESTFNMVNDISTLSENAQIPLCANGSTCSVTSTGFKCICIPGFQGSYCEEDVNECLSGPCLNGATCTNTPGSYTCTCPLGVTGTNCQTTPCSSTPCKNNGTCTFQGTAYACDCSTSTHAGVECEYVKQQCSVVTVGNPSSGGNAFADPVASPPVTGFKVDFLFFWGKTRSSNLVFQYGTTWGPQHTASLSADVITVLFAADEYITGVEATIASSGWVDALHIFTNKKNYGPYGAYSTTGLVRKHCDSGKQFAYITGKQGLWYNAINFHFV